MTSLIADPSPVCFVDTETTSLHADDGEVWEVGLITAGGAEYAWLLPVESLERADPISLEVGRFHDRHPQGNAFPRKVDAPFLVGVESFAREFAQLTHGCHLAGAVISFDEERLRRLLWSQGVSRSWHYHLVDVEALAAGFVAGSRKALRTVTHKTGEAFWAGTKTWAAAGGPDHAPPWNSNELSLAVGVDPKDYDRHTAVGDCRWARAIYRSVMDLPPVIGRPAAGAAR